MGDIVALGVDQVDLGLLAGDLAAQDETRLQVDALLLARAGVVALGLTAEPAHVAGRLVHALDAQQ